LHVLPYPGVDTILAALRRNKERIPNNDMLGTLVNGKYEWMSYSDMCNVAEHYSYGMMALDLVPIVNAED
jgi:hypothetical protein